MPMVKKGTPVSARNAYIEKMKFQLDQLNHEINKLQGKTELIAAPLIDDCQNELKTLQIQLQEAFSRFSEITSATALCWEKWKPEMDAAHDKLARSFHERKSQDEF